MFDWSSLVSALFFGVSGHFLESPEVAEIPDKYPETPKVIDKYILSVVIFSFDYSPSSSRHLDPFNWYQSFDLRIKS
jgi:hypothetical protein